MPNPMRVKVHKWNSYSWCVHVDRCVLPQWFFGSWEAAYRFACGFVFLDAVINERGRSGD